MEERLKINGGSQSLVCKYLCIPFLKTQGILVTKGGIVLRNLFKKKQNIDQLQTDSYVSINNIFYSGFPIYKPKLRCQKIKQRRLIILKRSLYHTPLTRLRLLFDYLETFFNTILKHIITITTSFCPRLVFRIETFFRSTNSILCRPLVVLSIPRYSGRPFC